jgi:hypothetical protein
MRVANLPCDARLAGEAGTVLLVAGECLVEQLDRDESTVLRPGPVHDAGRAPPELRFERVVVEPRSPLHERIL